MRYILSLLLAAAALCAVCQTAPAQKFLPHEILFQGDPEYTGEELMAATGLKKGEVLSFSDMSGYSQRLLATGIFATVAFKFDGQDLVFSLAPSPDLYPVRLDNLPLAQGAELDTRLRSTLPLYHGKVPAEGGLTDSVCRALEGILAAQGIKGTVAAVPATNPGTQKIDAVEFSLTSPVIEVGDIRLDGGSAPLDAEAQGLLGKLTGTPYGLETTPRQIVTNLSLYYSDLGYLDTKIQAVAQPPVVSPDAVRVPFLVKFEPGLRYRIQAVRLAPGLLVSQADFDRQAHINPGDLADGLRVRQNWEFLARQYHNHGYLKAVIEPKPVFDRTSGSVSYDVDVTPGPQYTMGALSIQNVADDLRTAMLAAWKMPAGAVFNEGAILSFFATQTNPSLRRVFAAVNCKYTLQLNDENRTVDVVLRLERR